MWFELLGMRDEHWNSDRVFEIGHLVPEATLTKHVAVIAGEHPGRVSRVDIQVEGGLHNSVVDKAVLLEHVKQLADAIIHVAHSAIVCTTSTFDLFRRKLVALEFADLL